MTEPSRLRDDDGAAPELRALLRGARQARPLDPVVRERVHARAARAAALPIGAVGWLSVKTALAAFGVTCGTAVVAVLVTTPPAPPASKALPSVSAASHRSAASGLPAVTSTRSSDVAAAPSPSPSAASSSVAAFPRQPIAGAPPSAVDTPALAGTASTSEAQSTLTAESELLERARRALRSSPLEALRLANEHAERFPHAQLGSERALIQIDALHRLGRDAEAQSIAQALLAGSPDGLYVERVRKLLGELE